MTETHFASSFHYGNWFVKQFPRSASTRIELELQERGIAVPSVSTIGGRKYLHVAVANHRSRREDFDLLVREVVRLGKELAAG